MPPQVDQQQYQYIKLPDGSYGKFRADATDDQIRTAVGKDFPDAFKAAEPSFLERAATQPSQFSHANPLRYADELGQGMAQGVQALAHPIDTAKNLYKFATAPIGHDTSGDKPLLEGLGDLADDVSKGYGQMATAAGAGKVLDTAGPALGKMATVENATAPIRMLARSAKTIGDIPGVGPALKHVRDAAYVNTPVSEIPKFNMPLQDVGLGKPGPIPIRPTLADGLSEVEAAKPAVEEHLRNVITDDRAMRSEALNKVPRSEGMPEVAAHQPIASGFLQRELSDMAGRGHPEEGLSEVEAMRPDAEEHLRSLIAPAPIASPVAPALPTRPPIQPAKVGDLLNEGLGGKPLNPKVPIKSQLENVTPIAPKESSVIQSHSYDPQAREMQVTTKNGAGYIHGDVSPEQAKAFAGAESKGKAWNDLRNNSTLVAKIVNGKRVPIQPTAQRMATPNDLTPILEESVRQAKAKKPSQ